MCEVAGRQKDWITDRRTRWKRGCGAAGGREAGERERQRTERLRGSSINRDSGDWKPELSNAYLLLLLHRREKERGRLIYKRRDKARLRRRERKPLSHSYSAARGSHASTDALRARTSSDCTPDVMPSAHLFKKKTHECALLFKPTFSATFTRGSFLVASYPGPDKLMQISLFSIRSIKSQTGNKTAHADRVELWRKIKDFSLTKSRQM